MIRCRFKQPTWDYRPLEWPIKHPYWCTGTGEDYHIIVAYADDEDEIRRLWPEAEELESEEVSGYVFTSRFKRPSWFQEKQSGSDQGT